MPRCATQLPWGFEEMRQNQSVDPIQQYANLPAALLNTLKREKKPFTYTPGGVNLSEVLEARLQKRLERKKKYMEEQEQEAGRLLVVSPTYNSPLNMYSVENALETLEVQAKMAANSRPLSCATLPRNYKFKFEEGDDDANEPPQSKAFRVLQVMTDTEPNPGDKRSNKGAMSAMRFSGLREGRTTNPSKFFHNLQKITGTEEDEEQEQERQESIIKLEKQRCVNPPQSQQQQPTPQPCSPFGSAPKLKRPAAFLPKQQLWSYQRTPVGTDF